MRPTLAALAAAALLAGPLFAMSSEEALDDFRFESIDGGTIGFADWAGRPVIVANTASLCGFTPQYADLQALWDAYRDQGLVVLAVPSASFAQELASEDDVRDFCEVNFGLTLPMTKITPVAGEDAHPFYRWLEEAEGFAPRWNFNKVLVGGDGAVLGTWGSGESPTGPAITGAVEAALGS